ncbi:MAG: ABC transporter substrate-binding protein [Oscillospiraceae bacterium]|nr:ABC transporter substrate-binding protein [Oscillospiraceae bacterium]
MKTKKKILAALMVLVLMFALAACGAKGGADEGEGGSVPEPQEKTAFKAVIIKQLDHASLDEIASAIEEQLKAEASKAGNTIEVSTVSGQNDPTVLKQLAEQAIAQEADVIIPIATLAAQITAAAAEGTGIPVVFAAISDPEGAGLDMMENVTGTSDALNVASMVDVMYLLCPEIGKVGLLYSLSETNSEKPVKIIKSMLDDLKTEYVEATAETQDEVKAAVSLLISAGVDVIFTPTDNVIMAAELAIYEDLIEAGIAHFAGADSFVRNGALATCGVNYTELGQKTAEMAFKAATDGMDGIEQYYTMPGGIVTVNTETASALGIDLTEAKKVLQTVVEVITTED